ncbi:MAG: hypothetical protein BWY78_01084 [Alphaproteobacteria bacterium ADurb.Bin438]|nr:MAG: hypothetical protein BWY78_01084 [Alphaproteobacteria bacterium ADurb.Bin438]
MKEIKVLGAKNCSTCSNLTSDIESKIKELGTEAKVEKVTEIIEIMKFGVMQTPAIVVNGKVVIKGRMPTSEEILNILQN